MKFENNINLLEIVINSWILYLLVISLLIIILFIFFQINKLISQKRRIDEININLNERIRTLEETNIRLKELTEKETKLETMDKLIGWFAHETKTPLEIAVTGLTTNKKLMEKFKNDSSIVHNSNEYFRVHRINENSNIVLDNIKQTNFIIKQLRVISLKQLESDLRKINLQVFISGIFEKLKYQRDNKNIKLVLTGDVDVFTTTYPIALDQVFSNLLLNSFKHGFADRKSGEIKIFVKRKLKLFEIEYMDNGKGINKEVQGKIFEEFFTSIKGEGGTGLGLAITRTIIERDFQGNLRLQESIPNERTIFKFHIKRFDRL